MQKQLQSIVSQLKGQDFQSAIDLCLLLLKQSNHPQIHLFLGIAYGEIGRTQEAYDIFENLIGHFPNNPEIFYNYALILQKNKQLNKAIIHYEKCLNLVPKNPSAWNNLGEIFRSQNLFDKAKDAFLNCLQLEPNNIQYNRNLALIYYQNKNYDKAQPILIEIIKSHDFELGDSIAALDSIISLRQLRLATDIGQLVLKKFNNNEEIFNLLGLNDLEKRKFKQSIKYFKSALKIKPNFFSAMCHLASAYLFYGKTKKCMKLLKKILIFKSEAAFVFACMMYETNNQPNRTIKTLEKGLELFPNNTELLLVKTKTLRNQKKHQQCLRVIEKILIDTKDDFFKATALYEKGMSLDKLCQYDLAWEAFVEANEMRLRQWQKLHKQKDPFVNTCNNLANSFNLPNIQTVEKPIKNNGSNLIFIVGFPRSGTTLLDSILSAHSDITVLEEAPIIGETYDQISNVSPENYAKRISELSAHEILTLRQFYFESLKGYSSWNRQGYLVDKSPLNTLHVGFIHVLFPQAKIIFSQRHPLDTCLSCFFQDFKINGFMTNMTNIQDSARTYQAMLKVWFAAINKFKIGVFYQSYEELVTNFEKQTKDLFKYLDIPWQDNVLNYQKSLKNRGAIATPSYNQVNQKIYQTAKNRYLNYLPYLVEPIKTLKPLINYFEYDV